MNNREIHIAGELAYYDGITSLIACKVLSVHSMRDVSIKITSNSNPAYKIGDIVATSGIWVIPRRLVRHRKYGPFILPILFQWSSN